MDWQIKFEPPAEKDLSKLDHQSRKKIRDYLRYKVLINNNPKERGKALTANKKGLWRYRVDKYRIVCKIKNNVLTVLVLNIAKRDKVYEK